MATCGFSVLPYQGGLMPRTSSPKANGCTQDVPAAIVISTFQKDPPLTMAIKLIAQNRAYDCVRVEHLARFFLRSFATVPSSKADRCRASSPKANGCTQDVPAVIVISTFSKDPPLTMAIKANSPKLSLRLRRVKDFALPIFLRSFATVFSPWRRQSRSIYQGGLMLRIEF